MLVAAAFVPSAPVLVPELAAGAAHELDDLREASDAAVECLLDADIDVLVVIGAAPRSGPYPAQSRGTFAPWGVDRVAGIGDAVPTLPLSLTMGLWFLDRCEWSGDTVLFGIASDEEPARCAALGAGLSERAERIGALVVGDGSAMRTAKAPGAFDERAEPFDATIDSALADATGVKLAELDASLAAELLVDGRAAWQVAAGLAGAIIDGDLSARVLRSEAPYGVHYVAASWDHVEPAE